MRLRGFFLTLIPVMQYLLIGVIIWFFGIILSIAGNPQNERLAWVALALQLVIVLLSGVLSICCICHAFAGRTKTRSQLALITPGLEPRLSRSLVSFKLLLVPWQLFVLVLINLFLGSSVFIAIFSFFYSSIRLAAFGAFLALFLYLPYSYLTFVAVSAYVVAEFLDQRQRGLIPKGLCGFLIALQFIPLADLVSGYIMAWMIPDKMRQEL